MRKAFATLATTFVLSNAAAAGISLDDLPFRGAADGLTISGVSSGAAMALQFAVAHSASVSGVGAIASPGWGCARSRVTRAISDCMCGAQTPDPETDQLLALARTGNIDALGHNGKARKLSRAYVFQSPSDATVVTASANAGIALLQDIVAEGGVSAESGTPQRGTADARHGFISPDGSDKCDIAEKHPSYVLKCESEDNAGRILHALYAAPGTPYDASLRGATPAPDQNDLPEWDLLEFDQQPHIDKVSSALTERIAPDDFTFFIFPSRTQRRLDFDMASSGYLFVPETCKDPQASPCRVHVALHGCRQDANVFARRAGYNNWATHYRLIVVYPAIAQITSGPEGLCEQRESWLALEKVTSFFPWFTPWVEPNPNGCWDWWGYLDIDAGRYLTKRAPQMAVIKEIVNAISPNAIE